MLATSLRSNARILSSTSSLVRCSRLATVAAPMRQPQAREETVNEHTVLKIPPEEVMVSTRATVHGRVVVREIGVVTAAHVCQKGFLHDVITSIIGFLGGENKQYSDLMNEATQHAVKKLQHVASEAGATAVVRTRFQTTTTMNRFIFGLHAAVLAYGTAVVCRPMTRAEREHMHLEPVRQRKLH